MSKAITPNNREIIAAQSTISNAPEYLTSTGGVLNVNASITPAGTQDTNTKQVNGVAVNVGVGTAGTGTQRVAVASDSSINAVQSGTWTVQPGNTANTTAWKVDGSAVTQPVSGTFWQTTQPISGTVTVTQSTGTNLHTVLDSGTLTTLTTLTGTTTLTPGTGATNLGKAEDAAHTTGDVGVMFLAVRNDDGAVLAGSNGDYVPITTDSSGAVRIDLNGTVSANNSSSATLTGNSVFTGTSDDCLIYNEVRISVFSDQASATNGLSIQQSMNNTNWDITDTYTIAASTSATYSVPRQARYIRIVYTNGSVNQTTFRLQTILNRMGTSAQSQRASDGYTNETDLGQNQSFGMIYNGTTWDRAREAINATNSTGTGIQAMGVLAQFDDVSPTAITENQFGNLRMSANRNMYSTIRDAAGNERGLNVDANGAIGVGSLIPGTAATSIGKAEDAAHTTGDTGIFALGVRNDDATTAGSGTNGDYTQLSTDANGRLVTVQKAKIGTETSVAGSASSVTILAANSDRMGAAVYNDSSAILYLRYSATAATTSTFTVKMFPEDYHEIFGGYTGQLVGIWASAAGSARVTELTS